MSVTLANFNAGPQVINQLGTYVYTVNNTATHVARIRLNVVPTTGITVLIKQNASTIATFNSPTTGQQEIELSCNIAATATDTISFVLTSSSAIDNQINVLKGTVVAYIGSNN